MTVFERPRLGFEIERGRRAMSFTAGFLSLVFVFVMLAISTNQMTVELFISGGAIVAALIGFYLFKRWRYIWSAINAGNWTCPVFDDNGEYIYRVVFEEETAEIGEGASKVPSLCSRMSAKQAMVRARTLGRALELKDIWEDRPERIYAKPNYQIEIVAPSYKMIDDFDENLNYVMSIGGPTGPDFIWHTDGDGEMSAIPRK